MADRVRVRSDVLIVRRKELESCNEVLGAIKQRISARRYYSRQRSISILDYFASDLTEAERRQGYKPDGGRKTTGMSGCDEGPASAFVRCSL